MYQPLRDYLALKIPRPRTPEEHRREVAEKCPAPVTERRTRPRAPKIYRSVPLKVVEFERVLVAHFGEGWSMIYALPRRGSFRAGRPRVEGELERPDGTRVPFSCVSTMKDCIDRGIVVEDGTDGQIWLEAKLGTYTPKRFRR